ncbi:MAG: undecaprenyl-diphosphate phosphatase [Clostridia bacterium]|nr:undecaprenyl-diphosphate phosphatase [Clostridia bacterium]
MLDWLKIFLHGLVQGVTEWLPISSTGHLILLERLFPLPVSEEFFSLFSVVIQLGSIAAVPVLYAQPLFAPLRAKCAGERQAGLRLWRNILLACLPSAVLGFLLDDLIDSTLDGPLVVACTLILYGILFLAAESRRRAKGRGLTGEVPLSRAMGIGIFQVLALIPGTSRSGATILGGMLLGLDRGTAAEFSFFLAIPTMVWASGLRGAKFALALARGEVSCTATEWLMLGLAAVVAFAVSCAVIRFLRDFVRRHTFRVFGIYRILLGGAVLASALAERFC